MNYPRAPYIMGENEYNSHHTSFLFDGDEVLEIDDTSIKSVKSVWEERTRRKAEKNTNGEKGACEKKSHSERKSTGEKK